jgi:hypothetical protein
MMVEEEQQKARDYQVASQELDETAPDNEIHDAAPDSEQKPSDP